MKSILELPADQIAKLKSRRLDLFLEKHKNFWTCGSFGIFIEYENNKILLPLEENVPNISVLKFIEGKDESFLTLVFERHDSCKS